MVDLSRFGIASSSFGILQSKSQHRFLVTMDVEGSLECFTKQIASIDRPSVVLEKVDGEWTHAWTPIVVVLRDDVTNVVSKFLAELRNKQEHGAKFQMNIETLYNDYKSIDIWSLIDCEITKISYGEMNYAKSDNVLISLEISYQTAIQSYEEVNLNKDLPLA